MTGFGYDPSHSIVKARQEGLQTVLYKPFRADRLMEAVEQALRPPASPPPPRRRIRRPHRRDRARPAPEATAMTVDWYSWSALLVGHLCPVRPRRLNVLHGSANIRPRSVLDALTGSSFLVDGRSPSCLPDRAGPLAVLALAVPWPTPYPAWRWPWSACPLVDPGPAAFRRPPAGSRARRETSTWPPRAGAARSATGRRPGCSGSGQRVAPAPQGRVRVEVPGLPPALDGLSIVHLSDLHFARLLPPRVLRGRSPTRPRGWDADLVALHRRPRRRRRDRSTGSCRSSRGSGAGSASSRSWAITTIGSDPGRVDPAAPERRASRPGRRAGQRIEVDGADARPRRDVRALGPGPRPPARCPRPTSGSSSATPPTSSLGPRRGGRPDALGPQPRGPGPPAASSARS